MTAFAAPALEAVLAADSEPNQWLVYGLMLLGGLLIGGAWAAREEHRIAAVVLGVLGALAFIAAVLWIYG